MRNITVGIDWGSSSFRAYRFNACAEVIDQFISSDGIKTLQPADYQSVLLSCVGRWLNTGDTVLLSGMITSRNGWLETPYLPCPLALSELLTASVSQCFKQSDLELELLFLPGAFIEQPADVMRGEELQLYGAVQNTKQLVVLPGTHSKWALVNHGVLESFNTVVTGELFDVLINKTLIGGLASGKDHIQPVFAEGVQTGFNNNAIVSELFTARSGVLLGTLQATEVASWLSGLLIGNEIRERYQTLDTEASILIIGSDELGTRYSQAFEQLGISAVVEARDPALSGFRKLIRQQIHINDTASN